MLPLAPETLIIAALTIPLIGAFLIPLFHTAPNVRESVTLITAAALALTVWCLVPHILAGSRPEAIKPGASATLFALMISPVVVVA
jgi:multicomponent Na+:H+ antiporter subunit D